MIFIAVKFTVLPDRSDDWLDLVADFTAATKNEPGNLWFEWSRSVEDANQFVLLEAFKDDDAGAKHVQSDHFKKAMNDLPPAIAKIPEIINTKIPGEEWNTMSELAPRQS